MAHLKVLNSLNRYNANAHDHPVSSMNLSPRHPFHSRFWSLHIILVYDWKIKFSISEITSSYNVVQSIGFNEA